MRETVCQPEQFLRCGLASFIKAVHLVTEINPSANEWFDDGRGDSQRLRLVLLPAAPVNRDVEAVGKPSAAPFCGIIRHRKYPNG